MIKKDGKGRLSTGIAGLNNILQGGLTPGHVYLIEGDPGTGKTTLGIQFLLEGIANDEPTLYITLAESQDELKAVALSHGFDISKIEIFEVKPPELEQSASDQYTVFHPSEVELVDVMQNILRKLEQTKAGRIVFDSMSEIRMLARDPLRYRRQILSLKQFFVGRKCTVLLLDDRTGDRTDRQLQSICHGAIRMETEAREYGPPQRPDSDIESAGDAISRRAARLQNRKGRALRLSAPGFSGTRTRKQPSERFAERPDRTG